MKPKKLHQVMDFDLKLLKIFKTVCDCKSFSSAESILGISRSAISIHMSDLEHRLGIRLCQRGRAGFALTEEGKEILEYIEVLTASVEDFRIKVNQMHDRLKGEFNIGIINNLVTMPINHLTQTLTMLAQHPDVIINISMSTLSDIECKVIDQRLHAGAIPLVTPLSCLNYFNLYDENSYLYCGNNHPLFIQCSAQSTEENIVSATGICLNDLKNWQAILPNYAITKEAMQLHELLDCTATASDREGIAFLILTGKYIGFLPSHFAKKWLEEGCMKPILPQHMHYKTSICLITRESKTPNIILKHFLETLSHIIHKPLT